MLEELYIENFGRENIFKLEYLCMENREKVLRSWLRIIVNICNLGFKL